jgi:hypothetical protein
MRKFILKIKWDLILVTLVMIAVALAYARFVAITSGK